MIMASCVLLMLSCRIEGFVGNNRVSSLASRQKVRSTITRNRIAIEHQDLLTDHEMLGSLMSTMYATTAKQSNEWSFLWFHFGSNADPYNTGQSLLPINPNDNGAVIRDYFLPTYSEGASNAAIAAQQKALQAGATFDASDMTILSPGKLPSSSSSNISPNPIDKNELEFIARSMDLVARKIPTAALLFATFDFFFIGANDVYKEDLEEDGPIVVADWVTQSAARVVAAFLIVFFVIFVDNVTYHPL